MGAVEAGGSQHIFIGRGGEVICPPVNMCGNSQIHRSLHQSQVLHEKIQFSEGEGGYSGWSDPKFQTSSKRSSNSVGVGGGGILGWSDLKYRQSLLTY